MIVGNKARGLQILQEHGFNVPEFFVLPPSYAGKPKFIRDALRKQLDPKKYYAVRSSGTKEDMPEFSFAGQYHTSLNARGIDEVIAEVKTCYESVSSDTVQAYLKQNDLSATDLQLAVVIQEMVQPDHSGVAFSVNPLTGNDKEIVVEITPGLGDALVSGRVNPEEYIYNWYDETFAKQGSMINEKLARELCNAILKVQTIFGYPCDVEFAIKDGTIYLLQTRAITKILFTGIQDEWTTADFRDGGVSSTVCMPFMWSLYEYIWEHAYRDFLHDALLLERKRIGKLGDMFYGRPYWNLTTTKQAMSNVPGYKEREFDNDLGIAPTYEGDGVTTSLTIKSIANALIILTKNTLMVRKRLKHNASSRQDLLARYDEYLTSVSGDRDTWQRLVFDDYLLSESTYFQQIFINTVAQSIYKENLLKHISHADYLKLLMGLDDISHLRPYRAIWDLSRKRTVTSKDIDSFLETYGYHSDKEIDVTYPHFTEDPSAIRRLIADTAKLGDEYNPSKEVEGQKRVYQNTLALLPNKLHTTVNRMRSLLWWREEFRDVSTRFYYLIRLYTIALAKDLVQNGELQEVDDIWFLKITDVKSYLDGTLSRTDIHNLIAKNKTYYDSFRHFTPRNEIGHAFDRSAIKPSRTNTNQAQGIGCSTGSITGVARVIEDISAIDQIQPGEILVTKFTDTGWTSKFAILGGVVTEYGGILCHAAIVSREYGIPCVVCATDIMKHVKNGQTITIDGETGKIHIGRS